MLNLNHVLIEKSANVLGYNIRARKGESLLLKIDSVKASDNASILPKGSYEISLVQFDREYNTVTFYSRNEFLNGTENEPLMFAGNVGNNLLFNHTVVIDKNRVQITEVNSDMGDDDSSNATDGGDFV